MKMTGIEAAKKHTEVFGGFPYFCYDATGEEDEYLTDLVNKAIERGEGLEYTDFRYPEGVTI